MPYALLIFWFAWTSPAAASEPIPPEVREALGYTMPPNECEAPDAQTTGLAAIQEMKVRRAAKKYRQCVIDYKQGLLKDFKRLKSSAQYGLTEAQAQTIMGHMLLIQETIMSPRGLPPDPESG